MPDPAIIEAVVLVVLLWVVVDRAPAFLRAADDLGIGLFKPWRGDPWPRGVQEDDDFRFDWRPARANPVPALDLVVDIGVHAATGDRIVVEPMSAWIDDEDGTDAGRVALERPEHVEIHPAGR
jgi:hypothetical protein